MTSTATVPATYRLTFEDWLRYPDDGNLYEILGGELFVAPTPTSQHQRIVRKLLRVLDSYCETGARGEAFCSPLGVKLSPEDIVQPDLMVVLREHSARIEKAAIVGSPDLVVEILSPGTAGRDLGHKRGLYESFGIPEYWIVDPVAETIEVLALAGRAYRHSGLYRSDQALLSPLLGGLEIPLAQIF